MAAGFDSFPVAAGDCRPGLGTMAAETVRTVDMAAEGSPTAAGRSEDAQPRQPGQGSPKTAQCDPADAAGSEPAGRGMPVDEPAKVVRIGRTVGQLLEEVRNGPLDEGARYRLASIY